MRISSLFHAGITVAFIVGLSSCEKAGDAASLEMTILPGECLNSPELVFSELRINDYTGPEGFVLTCLFDVDAEKVQAGEPYAHSDFKYVPTERVFARFGENADAVSDSYDNYWKQSFPEGENEHLLGSTIVYESGITLVADKDFAGFKAGENIAANAGAYKKGDNNPVYLDYVYPSSYLTLPGIPSEGEFSYNYILCYDALSIRIPIKEYTIVDEDVTFTLFMPVKVGLLLTWFNEKLTNPNAPFPFKEETLTCSFTIHKGLR